MSALPVSCFIITRDEADRISRTVESVRSWVDEVVVVDSESTDATVEIARAKGCRVVVQPWLGFGGQKRFAEEQCRNDWVLNVDADEVITPALKEEIVALFAQGKPPLVAYGMPLQLIYPGAQKPRPWARDHWYVRLYDRRAVRFRDSAVHDTVVTSGYAVGKLRAAIHHHTIRSFDDMKRKLEERMLLSATQGTSYSAARLAPRIAFEFPMNFFKYFIVRRHFMGGISGIRYAWIQASYRWIKVNHMWRQRHDQRLDNSVNRNGDDGFQEGSH
jgi:glycosyltransferase involved in cell wall biosynthesis